MIAWHLGGAIFLFRWIFRDPRGDVRFLALGALLPDLIDLPLGLWVYASTEAVAHSLLLPGLYLLAVLAATRRGGLRTSLITVGVGWLFHLLLDGAWTDGRVFLWPLFGFDFPESPQPFWSGLWDRTMGDLWRWGKEVAGLLYLGWLWRHHRRRLATAALAVLAACSQAAAPAVSTLDLEDPVEVAVAFVGHMNGSRFSEAAALTELDQMALIALVEGAPAEQAAALLDGGAKQVASNYWSSFMESIAPSLVRLDVGTTRRVDQDGVPFLLVEPAQPGQPRFVLRRATEWRVDVLASFGASIAPGLAEAAVVLEGRRGPEVDRLLALITEQRPSLMLALTTPGLPEPLTDSLEALVELIDRLG
jgi:hypothetical protein